MERIRAEMGNPRFTGKGAVIEGVLTLKFLVDCSDVSELAMIEDLSALAEKTVIVTLEPIQQEMRFEAPKRRKAADDDEREPELIPKTWEVRINPVAVETEPAKVGQFWSFIAQEALAEIPAACLLAPFLPGSDGEQLVSMRVTTPERDMIVGYLATRAFEAAGGTEGVAPLLLTFVGDTAEAVEDVPEPWLMVGKPVLVPAEHAPEWANVADHGGFALALVVEILNGEDGQPQDVEVQFTNEADGEVSTLVLQVSEVSEPIAAAAVAEWPVVGSWVQIPGDVAWDADAAVKVVDGFADGEVRTIEPVDAEPRTATVCVNMLSGAEAELTFLVEVLLNPQADTVSADDAEPAAGDAAYPETPVPDHVARQATLPLEQAKAA